MFFLELLNHKSVFSVKWTDKSAKESVKHQLIHEAREAIDKTSFHALPLVTADVASWFKVQHFKNLSSWANFNDTSALVY